ncbi:hypothetical protein EZV73_08195 [Acidaminobacter sp. JC074]|uniref:hypothetical protein n=1 Tax=Acidaminobacter sp. JC074 TaxID=2530199 RepID=UPI001F0E8130|nr:hypothetical protein [Acidaminobacter sp. JC074]MCH4887549.1 hypothetical protein [Acidaminobacter sp. JC074]
MTQLDRLLKIMNPGHTENIRNEVIKAYNEIYPRLQDLLDLKCYHIKSTEAVYVGITLGNRIDALLDKLWNGDDPFLAMLCDQLLVIILFEASENYYLKLKEDAISHGHGLSRRFTPGDELSLEDNSLITNKLKSPITTNDYHVLIPQRSLVYKYLIQEHFDACEDINCNQCDNQTCHMRK